MIKAVVFDFCRVFLFPKKEDYFGELNSLHKQLSQDLSYNFTDHFEFNNELIDFVKENHFDTKYPLYIFTSGEIQKAADCQRFLNGYFKKIFSASELNISKKEASAYLMIAENIGLNPNEILFVDDDRQNTIAAETAGFSTLTFRNNMQFETEFEGYVLNDESVAKSTI